MTDQPDDDNWIATSAKSPYLPIVAGLFRGVVGIASSFGFTWALTVTGDQATMAATAVVALAMLGWSAWQKIASIRAARRAEVGAAKASAAIGKPVTVVETPVGQSNVAVLISREEMATAPAIPPVGVVPSPAPVA